MLQFRHTAVNARCPKEHAIEQVMDSCLVSSPLCMWTCLQMTRMNSIQVRLCFLMPLLRSRVGAAGFRPLLDVAFLSPAHLLAQPFVSVSLQNIRQALGFITVSSAAQPPLSEKQCASCRWGIKRNEETSASNAAIAKAARNGMHLPSAGFACFIAMLCLTPTPDWKS